MDDSGRWRVFTTREEAEEWCDYIPPLWEYPGLTGPAKLVLDKKFPDSEWEELMLNQEWERIESSMNPAEFIMCKEDLDILKNDRSYTNYKERLRICQKS